MSVVDPTRTFVAAESYRNECRSLVGNARPIVLGLAGRGGRDKDLGEAEDEDGERRDNESYGAIIGPGRGVSKRAPRPRPTHG